LLVLLVSAGQTTQASDSASLLFDEASADETPITDTDRQHWAFLPLSRVEPPAVRNRAWVANPIDRFVLHQLEENDLTPSPAADRTTLIRRVYFDLLGLPPDPDEVARFTNDPAADAYQRLVDRLLASPAFGERWAQHWLDLARYADTDGFEHDLPRPQAWRYRDWTIDAINRDLPYDEFVQLQIAGDELRPGDVDAAIATGFARCGSDMPDINDQDERRHMLLNEMTSTIGAVFLGLQVGCAQCHDHKFDPFSQADFFRLRAFFEQSDVLHDQPLGTIDQINRYRDAKAKHDRLRQELKDQLAQQQARPDGSGPSQTSRLPMEGQSRKDEDALRTRLRELESNAPTILHARILRDDASRTKPSFLMIAGDFRRPGPKVRPAFPRIVRRSNEVIEPTPTPGCLGLRAALAKWLTRPDHPLTTRVIVNRVWQHHFGRGLVETPSDFGLMGDSPTHPELLDWLATELPRGNWSLKHLHRLIVLSSTYQQASRPSSPGWSDGERLVVDENWNKSTSVDPQNRLYWRQNRRRMEAEVVRDALLACSGSLSQRKGGPGIMPPLPREALDSIRKDQWQVSPNAEDHRRRSIYLFVRRNLRDPFLEVFDRPDTNASCPERNVSTIAPQSLALLNSNISAQAAAALAGRILDSTDDSVSQIDTAYWRILARAPSEDERQASLRFVQTSAARIRSSARSASDLLLPSQLPQSADRPSAAALTMFCLSLFNLNEFIYVD
jgi:hypothetical protein